MTRAAGLLLALASLTPPQDPPRDSNPSFADLESKLSALGPFRAEYLCGTEPDRTLRIIAHLDFKGPRALIEFRQEGPRAEPPPFRRLYTRDFAVAQMEADFLTFRRDCTPVFEALDRAYFDLRRLDSDSGPIPAFPRIVKPFVTIGVNERREPRGSMSLSLGYSLEGGFSWLKNPGGRNAPVYDAQEKAWLIPGPRGRRMCVDDATGLIRWLEIQIQGKTVRCVELKELKTGVPFPDFNPSDHYTTYSMTPAEIAGVFGRTTMETLWKAWAKAKGGPRDAELKAIAVRFVASIAELLEAGEIRIAIRNWFLKEFPDDGSWTPGSEALNAARARFLDSLKANAAGSDERRLTQLEEWRASLKISLEADENEGATADVQALEFLKTGFDKEALRAERARRTPPDAAALFKEEESFWPPVVHFLRGAEAMKKGDAARAEAQLGAAIRLWPRMAEAYMNRANVRMKVGHVDGAIEDYDKALGIKPYLKGGFRLRGEAWVQKKELTKAVEDLTRAIDQDPADRRAWVSRGWCRRQLKDDAGAVADYTKAIEMDPKDATVLVSRGYCRWNLGELDQAGADFTKAIEIDPGNANALYLRGSLRRKSDPKAALADVEKALENAPKDWVYQDEAEKLLRDLKK